MNTKLFAIKAKERNFNDKIILFDYIKKSNTPELKKFVDLMLMLERCNENRPKARLTISIGKALYKNGKFDKFISTLNSRTDNPTVFISSFGNEPMILIQDRLQILSIASINLTDINNLQITECTNSETATYFDCTFHSVHNNLDYQINLKVTK